MQPLWSPNSNTDYVKNIEPKNKTFLLNTCLNCPTLIVWVSNGCQTPIQSASKKRKNIFYLGMLVWLFQHLSDFSNVCRTCLVQVLDTMTRLLLEASVLLSATIEKDSNLNGSSQNMILKEIIMSSDSPCWGYGVLDREERNNKN